MQVSVVVQPSCVAQSSGGAVRVVCTQNVPAQNETVARERAAAPPRVDTQIVAGRTVVTVMF